MTHIFQDFPCITATTMLTFTQCKNSQMPDLPWLCIWLRTACSCWCRWNCSVWLSAATFWLTRQAMRFSHFAPFTQIFWKDLTVWRFKLSYEHSLFMGILTQRKAILLIYLELWLEGKQYQIIGESISIPMIWPDQLSKNQFTYNIKKSFKNKINWWLILENTIWIEGR